MALIRRQQIAGAERTFLDIAEHFIGNITASQGGAFNFIGVAVSPGVFGILSGEAGSPGIARLQTGAASTGGYMLRTPTSIVMTTGTVWNWSARVRLPTLATSTEAYQAQVGFGDATATNVGHSNALMFRHNTSSLNWQFVTLAGGISTIIVSTVPVVAGTWYNFTLTMDATGRAFFGIDGAITEVTTTLPNTASNPIGLILSMAKTAGSLSRFLEVDFVSLRAQL